MLASNSNLSSISTEPPAEQLCITTGDFVDLSIENRELSELCHLFVYTLTMRNP